MTDDTNTYVINDDNLPNVESYEEDLPLEEVEVVKKGSVRQEKAALSQAAIIQSHLDGSSISENYLKFKGEYKPLGLLGQKAQEKADADVQDLQESFIEDSGSDPTSLGQNAALVRGLQNEIRDSGSDVPRHVVEAASSLTVEEEVQAKVYNRLKFMEGLNKAAEGIDGWDMAIEVLTSILPTSILKDNIDLTGSAFNADEVVSQTVLGFKNMTAEEQREYWPTLVKEANEALPKGQAISYLSKFLDPLGEDDVGDYHPAWAVLDAVDVALTGFALLKVGAKVVSKTNTVKILKDLDNVDEAANINAAGILDETGEVVDELGIPKETLYNNAAPFNTSDIDDAYVEGLASATIDRIKEVKKNQIDITESLVKDKEVLRLGAVTGEDRVVSELNFVEQLNKTSDIENIKKVGSNADSTLFSYDVMVDGKPVPSTAQLDLRLNDVGVWENNTNSLLPKFAFSPSAWAKGDSKKAVREAVALDNLTAKVGDQLFKLQRKAVEPLLGKHSIGGLSRSVRKQMAEIDEVLLEGDRASREYTTLELKAGVNGVPLNEKQVEVYFNVRNLYDNLDVIRNAGERRAKVAKGHKAATISGEAAEVKPYMNVTEAQSSLNISGTQKVYIDDIGKEVSVSKLDLKDLYNKGYVMVKADSAVKVKGSPDSFRTIFVKGTEVGELPRRVIPHKKGYVPSISRNANWFLKEYGNSVVDGVATRTLIKTHRRFDNKAEALEVLEEFKASGGKKDFEVLEDREAEQAIKMGTGFSNSGGGLYKGKRAQEEIGFGRDNVPTERYGAFESLSMNLQSLGTFMSRNQWRIGQEQKWINTAKKLGVEVDRFDPRLVPENTEAGSYLRAMGEHIQQWSGFPSKDELIFQEKIRGALEWSLGSGLNRSNPLVRGLKVIEDKDPVAAARTATFHTLLGFYNPVQYWIQAQGFSTSLAMATKLTDPLGGLRAVKNQMALGLVEDVTDPTVFKAIEQGGGFAKGELKEIKDLWLKTGYREGILTTADHAGKIHAHGVGMQSMRLIADAGLTFYKRGEMINRRTAFVTALQEFKHLNKGVKVGDKQLLGIMERANDLTLMLSKANRAGHQTGLASIPTQFMQVQNKMIESMLGLNDSFTGAERWKLLFVNLGLYGTVGVPMGGLAVRWYMQASGKSQEDIDNMSPEQIKAINEGLWGYMALAGLGADVDMSKRGAILSGVENLTTELMFGDSTFGEAMLGAFGQVPTRFFNAYTRLKPLMLHSITEAELPTGSELAVTLQELTSILSSMNSAQKAIFMHNRDQILDKRNNVIAEKDFNLATEILVGMGFQPSSVARTYEMDAMVKNAREHRSAVTSSIVMVMNSMSREIDGVIGTEKEAEVIDKYVKMQAYLLSNLKTDRDRDLVIKAVKGKLTSDSKETKAVRAMLQEFNDGRVADLHTLHGNLKARGLIQISPTDKEE